MTRLRKALFLALGSLFVVLAFIGIFIPVLPTTPFLLLAAFFFTRSSDRALYWLENNRLFGAYIRNYRQHRGMSLRDKVVTLSFLWVAILLTILFLVENPWVRLLLLVVAVGVTLHLSRLKTFRSGQGAP